MGRPKKELSGDNQLDLFEGSTKKESSPEMVKCEGCNDSPPIKGRRFCWPCQARDEGICPACGEPFHSEEGQGRFMACDRWLLKGFVAS